MCNVQLLLLLKTHQLYFKIKTVFLFNCDAVAFCFGCLRCEVVSLKKELRCFCLDLFVFELDLNRDQAIRLKKNLHF